MNLSTGPPPGWYLDATGFLRWWDGAAWGPYAPPGSPTPGSRAAGDDGRLLSALAHLGMFFGGIVLPLVVYLTEGRRNPFVRHHASEALNFQITVLVGWVAGFVLLFATFLPAVADQPPVGFFAVFPILFLGGFVAMGVSILAAVRAGQGLWWRYPLTLRLVKGAGTGGEVA